MKKGDIVKIYNRTMSGKLVVEGKAVLVCKIGKRWDSGREQWMVRFTGESQTYPRWVEKEEG